MITRSSEIKPQASRVSGPVLAGAALLLMAAVLLVFRSDRSPAIWFDEGWNLSVARNLAVSGFYGELSLGEPAPPTLLSTGLPVIAPIATSFRLFGVGGWQGRLPGILFAATSLLLLAAIVGAVVLSKKKL